MDQMVNNIQLVWKLACMFRTYRTCDSSMEFSKYKFINKLLNGVTLLRITSGVTWTWLYIYNLNLNSPLWKNWLILLTHKALDLTF